MSTTWDVYGAQAFSELSDADQRLVAAVVVQRGEQMVFGLVQHEGAPTDYEPLLRALPSNQRAALERLRDERVRVRQEANEQAREAWQGKLAAQKAEQTRESRERQQATLVEVKGEQRRLWLVDHPGTTADDFEKIWGTLLEQLQHEDRTLYIEKRLAEKRRMGGF